MSIQQSQFDYKKGEINELQSLLRNPAILKDNKKKRDIIKKIIGNMTSGIDVSKLFSDMVISVATNDFVIKKMVYLYLTSQAETKPDVALLCINTLQKDCRDENPMIRGMALRSLCSLRLPNIVEYFMAPIRNGLLDVSPYVRKTAVMGIAKVYALVPYIIKDSDLIDVLYNLIKDKDCQVITNSLVALNEILLNEGGIVINQAIVVHLLTRLTEFSEWGQCTVLELLMKYKPQNDEEMFSIMNFLEDRLRHSNAAVVLAATKVFLNITRHQAKIHLSIYSRLRAPLLTLMSSNVELSYTVLSHVVLLISRAPNVFEQEYKSFYCKYNDITCVKSLKVDILTMLATNDNRNGIISELSEYVTDVDPELARQSIRAMAKIAIRLESACDHAIKQLVSLLELHTDYVTAQTCVTLKDILRKYPERYQEIIPALEKCLQQVQESEGKAAVIWMIGEYGDLIEPAPYILEPLIDSYEEELSYAVRCELLAATMKLFFKRPPEVRSMLGRLLKKAVDDSSNVDIRDRALLYYRLLKADVLEAARVVHGVKSIVDAFVDTNDAEIKERLLDEFNTLSVIYGIPSDRFTNSHLPRQQEKDNEVIENFGDSSETLVNDEAEKIIEIKSSANHVPDPFAKHHITEAKVYPPRNNTVDILDDLMGGVSLSAPASVSLVSRVSIDPPQFQSKWMALPISNTLQINFQVSSVSKLESLLTAASIFTLASGNVNGVMKLYSYAQELNTNKFFLAEAITTVASGICKVTFKSESSNALSFEKFYQQTLQSIISK